MILFQRLAGATLLVFANKQDLPGALSKEAIQEVGICLSHLHSITGSISVLKSNMHVSQTG